MIMKTASRCRETSSRKLQVEKSTRMGRRVAPSNHASQSSLSECMASPSPLNCFKPSRALIFGQRASGSHSWRGPMLPGSGWTCAETKFKRPSIFGVSWSA